MASSLRGLAALLRRAALLAGVLAVLAGILGMHVMTTGHAAHAAHSVSHEAGAPASAPGQVAMGHAGAGHADHGIQPGTSTESCAGSCPGMHGSGAACIPLAKTGSLTVFPPAGTLAAETVLAHSIRPAAAYSYIPASPTPCELSISRT
jgi:hypothetical protein